MLTPVKSYTPAKHKVVVRVSDRVSASLEELIDYAKEDEEAFYAFRCKWHLRRNDAQ
jgi:hypothetical protein